MTASKLASFVPELHNADPVLVHVVDDAIVVIENIHRHLSDPKHRGGSRTEIIATAASRVARPILFSVAIVIIVFLDSRH